MPTRPDLAAGPAPTVGSAVAAATATLARAGSATPRLDAEVLLAEVLGVSRAQLVIGAAQAVGQEPGRRFAELVARRAAHEPVAYLIGRRGFRRLELAVDPRVLIPRPETELLVELAAAALPAGARVADVGTGSGAIALALADERPDLRVVGIDRSEAALAVARANAAVAAGGGVVELRRGDLLADVAPEAVDAVLANLPYVEEAAALPPDVVRYEPADALFGGADGLDVIRRLCAQLADRPAVRWVGLEIGARQAAAVTALVRGAGFSAVSVHRDLAGLDRAVVGVRRP